MAAGKTAKEQSKKDKKAAAQANHIKSQPALGQTRAERRAAREAAAAASTGEQEVTPSVAEAAVQQAAPAVDAPAPAAPTVEAVAQQGAVEAPAAVEAPSNATLEQGQNGFVAQKKQELEDKIAEVNAAKKAKNSPRKNIETLTEREQAILDEIKTSRSGKKSVKDIADAFNKSEVPNDEFEAPDKSSSKYNADPASEKEERERERSQIAQKHAESLASEDFHQPTQEEVENRGNPNWRNPERESRYEEMKNLRSGPDASPKFEDLVRQFEERTNNARSTAAREAAAAATVGAPATVEQAPAEATAPVDAQQQAAAAAASTGEQEVSPAATVGAPAATVVNPASAVNPAAAVEAPAEATREGAAAAQLQQAAPAAAVEAPAAAVDTPAAAVDTPAATVNPAAARVEATATLDTEAQVQQAAPAAATVEPGAQQETQATATPTAVEAQTAAARVEATATLDTEAQVQQAAAAATVEPGAQQETQATATPTAVEAQTAAARVEATATVDTEAQVQQATPAAVAAAAVETSAATATVETAAEAATAPAVETPSAAREAASTPDPETGQTQQAAQSSPEEEEEKLEKSWLSKIPNRDSSRPLNFKVIKNLVKEGHKDLDIHNIEGKLTQENGVSKKAFDDGITNVELTYKKHSAPNDKLRDVDINIKKGPAVVTLAMSDEKGQRRKGQGLVIEYDKNGNPIDSVPDLRLARFDKSTPPVASIMVGKEVIYLPINGNKVKDLMEKIEARKGKIREQDRKLAKEVGSETPTPALSDIELQYKELYKQHKASAFNSPEAKDLLSKCEEAKRALLDQEPKKEQGAKLSEINKKADEELKAQAEKDLKEALKAEISAKAKGEDPSVTDTTKKENAKKILGNLGENAKQIENIEKKAKKEAYSEALREQFAHMLAAGDGEEAKRKQEVATQPDNAPKILDFLKDAYSHLASQELSERQQGQDPAETVLLQQSVVQYSSELGKTITPQEELEYKKQAVKTAASESPEQQESIKKAADKMLGVYQDRGQKLASAVRSGFESTVHAISSIPTKKKGQEASMGR